MAVSDDLAFAADEFRQLAEFFESEGNVVFGKMVRAAEARMRRALEAADAVRGGDAAPPAGTVPVRVCTAMTSVAEMPGYMEGHTFFAFSDGTIWCRGQTNGDWARVEGPPSTIHAPLRDVPEVGAVVEPKP